MTVDILPSITAEQFLELGFTPHYTFNNTYERKVKTKEGEHLFRLNFISEFKSIGLDHYLPNDHIHGNIVFVGIEIENFDNIIWLMSNCIRYKYILSKELK